MQRKGRTRSRSGRVAELVRAQHGVVSRSQLLRLGIGAGAIDHRLRTGRLVSIMRGVYALSPASLSRRGRWMAAVLACGPGAALSHRSAAALWGLVGAGGPVHVTVPRRVLGPAGIIVHFARLEDADRGWRDRIPITSPSRTLLDLAATEPGRLRSALDEADRLWHLKLSEIESLLARCGGHAGRARLAALVAEHTMPALPRSQLEVSFLDLCRDHGLPLPEMNGRVGAIEVDFVWHRSRLAVEADGYANHRTRAAWERDYERAALIRSEGYDLRRFNRRQINEEAATVAALVRDGLAAHG